MQRRNKQTINDETKEQTAFCTSTCIGIRLGSQKNFETFETFWTFETREPRYFEMKLIFLKKEMILIMHSDHWINLAINVDRCIFGF